MRSFSILERASGYLVAIVQARTASEAATLFWREHGFLFQAAFPRGDFHVA